MAEEQTPDSVVQGAATPPAERMPQRVESDPDTTEPRPLPQRDGKGKFKAKRPLEFTWPHFILEVGEVTIAILLAQGIWEIGVWIFK